MTRTSFEDAGKSIVRNLQPKYFFYRRASKKLNAPARMANNQIQKGFLDDNNFKSVSI